MRCRICDLSRRNSPKHSVCRVCEYVMGLNILSISEYYSDITKLNKSLRMKQYYIRRKSNELRHM